MLSCWTTKKSWPIGGTGCREIRLCRLKLTQLGLFRKPFTDWFTIWIFRIIYEAFQFTSLKVPLIFFCWLCETSLSNRVFREIIAKLWAGSHKLYPFERPANTIHMAFITRSPNFDLLPERVMNQKWQSNTRIWRRFVFNSKFCSFEVLRELISLEEALFLM